ncbi:uncharacterized protein LOC118435846 [Folsomia candida]|uniref:uncharacterized protein LOC118435846 n=1 Tax=Folsomia candida TaxID=158441 RepID=UPI001604C413|nr:uncharacterized protein LOC118435846 [Folsomia candida]
METHNLISTLPEIISQIMEFLPSSDLESASLVHPTWEKEALRHLLIRNPVDVLLTNSKALLPLRKLSPKHLNVIVCAPEENAETFWSKIDSLAATSTVTKFSIYPSTTPSATWRLLLSRSMNLSKT